jgi:predicted site-specific integrase-resolvase
MTENNYMTQTQLAERWQVAESTLERWRSEGIGPIYMKMRGRTRDDGIKGG